MGKALVIVESPAKAKTINKYLGSDFVVKSSIGHIRDLPVSGQGKVVDAKARAKAAAETRKLSPEQKLIQRQKNTRVQLIGRMGVNPEKNWEARYEILPGKEKVVDELRRLAKTADTIYLATDLDREGEAIAWHLQQAIGGDEQKYRRVVFNEITKNAIQEAFKSPGKLDINRVNAQQARRFLDRVVGYMLSPLLWSKIARGLSAGRVQSVAVRIVVDREREIRAFNPEEFWRLGAQVSHSVGNMQLDVTKYLSKEYRPADKAASDAHVARLQNATFVLESREDKPTSSKAAPPFITSTLQQAASTQLGFSVKKTMMMAQRLYEAGYITYMRTDSTNLSADAVTAARALIASQYGEEYLPKEPVQYGSSKSAQEAHEAIRTSDANVKATQLTNMERDAERLYELIWRRFIACQMMPAKYKSTKIKVAAADYQLSAKGRILVFDGYTRVNKDLKKQGDDLDLPDIAVGSELILDKLSPVQHFTKPSPRFTEASLVKELEKRGIGRPSTYASIISTIQDRGYVSLTNKRFYAEKMGDIVTERLVENFDDLMDYNFTAHLETDLDAVATGKVEWLNVLNDFYRGFSAKLSAADQNMRLNDPVETDIDCPSCGRKMGIRNGSTGVFLGCSGYALPPKERCKTTINLVPGDEVISADADDEAESRLLITKKRCSICDTAMESYLLDESRKLHICGNNPDCGGYEIEQGEFKIKGYDGPVLDCDKCGDQMQLKTGRFGKYFGCMSDDCKNTRKLLRSGEPAPPKADPIHMPDLKCRRVEDYYVLRDGASGIFLAASKFPRNRETRAPFVKELVPVRDQLDPKLTYLAHAPLKDNEGNDTQIRYSRKTKEQYAMTENDAGKPTGWRAFYENGKWVAVPK